MGFFRGYYEREYGTPPPGYTYGDGLDPLGDWHHRQTVTPEIERTHAQNVKRFGIIAAEQLYREYCRDMARSGDRPTVIDRHGKRIGSVAAGGYIDV